MNERDIFLAALDKPTGAEREACLSKLCGNDEALRQRVDALFRADQAADKALAPPLGTTTPPEPELPEGIGTVIGPYKLLQKLGEGGMGAVYLASQEAPMKRLVALKIIKPGMDSRQVITRFEAERQALAMMDHPNIAKVLDAGTIGGARDQGRGVREEIAVSARPSPPGSRPYFVMELVKGIPITKFCDQEHLTPEQRLQLFIPVCQAVQHAHQKGIIHRDLKPSNVLVALYDGVPIPKVIDFGVAKATGQRLTDQTMFTEVGQIVGTLEYMSPEQAELNNLDIDTRTDIYALGVILYELLTGTKPFDSQRLRHAAFAEMLRIIREEEPQKPSTRLSSSGDALPSIAAQRQMEPRKLSRLLAGDLDWIVMKALAKERHRRYETANGFALDIQRHLAHEPVSAGPPSVGYRVRKFVRRNRVQVVAAAVVLLALVGGIAGTTWGLIRAENARADAQNAAEAEKQAKLEAQNAAEAEKQAKLEAQNSAAAEKQAKLDAQKAADAEKQANAQAQKRLKQIEKGIEILTSVFHDIDPTAEENGGESLQVLLGKRLGEAAKQLEGEAVGDPVVVARLQTRLGQSLNELAHYDQAEAVLNKASRTLEASLGANDRDTLTAKHYLANVYLRKGKYPEAEALGKEVLAARIAKLGPNASDTLTTRGHMLWVYEKQGKYPEAEKLCREILAVDPGSLTNKSMLAALCRTQGKYPEAEKLFKEALAGETAKWGADSTRAITTKNNLAILYRTLGKYTEADKLYREILDVQIAKLGATHDYTLTTKNNLAVVSSYLHNNAEAERLLKEVIEVMTGKLGAGNPYVLNAKANLAGIYREEKKYAEAEKMFKEVLTGYAAKMPADHPFALAIKQRLAVLYGDMKKWDQSIPLLEEIAKQQAKKQGPGHPDTLLYLASLGKNYRDAGRLDDGIRCLKEAVAGIRKLPAPVPPMLAWVHVELAETYYLAKQHGKSEPLYRAALQQARQEFGNEDARTTSKMASLGLALLYQNKHAEAEPLLRECLAIRGQKQPGDWRTFNTMSMLGGALLGQKKYADAEKLLKEALEGLKQSEATIPEQYRTPRLTEALERLAQLYEATDKKDEAAKLRRELQEKAKGNAGARRN